MKKRNLLGFITGCVFIGISFGITIPFCYGESEEDIVEYEYDELNRVIQAIYPDGTKVTYNYDKNGNLTESVVTPPEEVSTSGTVTGSTSATGQAGTTEESGTNTGTTSIAQEEPVGSGGAVGSGTVSGSGRNSGDTLLGEDSDATGSATGENEIDLPVGTGDSDFPDGAPGDASEAEQSEETGNMWWLTAIIAAGAAGGAVWGIRRKKHEKE